MAKKSLLLDRTHSIPRGIDLLALGLYDRLKLNLPKLTELVTSPIMRNPIRKGSRRLRIKSLATKATYALKRRLRI